MSLLDWYKETLAPMIIADPERGYGPVIPKRIIGRHARGPCPLHGGNDDNWSFDRQTARWRCWSQCGESGDLVLFLARRDGVQGKVKGAEWVKYLRLAASMYDLSLPTNGAGAPKKRSVSKGNKFPKRKQITPEAPAKGDPTWRGDHQAYWERCQTAACSDAVMMLIQQRIYNANRPRMAEPNEIDSWDLLRGSVIPKPHEWFGGLTSTEHWAKSMPIVIRTWDHDGVHRGFRWRKAEKKSDSFKASGSSNKGLVMADDTGVAMLRGQQSAPLRVLIAEGETDWLTACYHIKSAGTPPVPVAILGIVQGSWDKWIADRIPNGSSVVIMPDLDDPGSRYEREILRTLQARIARGELEYWTRERYQKKTPAGSPARSQQQRNR